MYGRTISVRFSIISVGDLYHLRNGSDNLGNRIPVRDLVLASDQIQANKLKL